MRELKLLLRKDFWILKNNLLLILKNPLRLLPYLVLVGYFTFIYSQRIKSRRNASELGLEGVDQIDYSEQNIIGVITLLVLVFLIFQLFRATKRNVTFFKMADVNLLFPAPVRPENLLLYYMIRSLIPSIGGALLFMVYGGSQLAGNVDLNFGTGTFMVLGFALFFFMIFPIRFLVYTLHTKYGIMEYFRFGVILLGIVLGLMVVIPGLMADKLWQGMFSWIASPWFDFFPLVGWSRGILSFGVHGNWVISVGFILLYILAFYSVLRLVIQFSGYYYEDVLEATKSNEEKLEKARGKKEVTEDTFSLNTKKQLALPDFGVGAKALYWRNYVHSSRQDFHPLVGIYSLSLAGIGIVMAGLSNFEWFSHKVLYIYLILLLGFYFMAGISRASIGDLKKPWFILIPASWGAKFWNMIKLDLLQIAIFSVLLIVPSVFLAKVSLGLIPLFVFGIICSYLIGLSINLIPQVALEETWDRFLIKPLMIGGIFLFGIIPVVALGILVFVVFKKFVWTLLVFVIGFAVIAAILLHVAMDLLKRLEFKEL